VRDAVVLASWMLCGCVSMDGPCQIDLRVDDDGQAHRSVECEAGGSIWMLAPKDSIEAAGKICQTKEKP
jgi:hypothetical protein